MSAGVFKAGRIDLTHQLCLDVPTILGFLAALKEGTAPAVSFCWQGGV